jgi:hypothetical protein
MTATTELVVPRSIPMIFSPSAMFGCSFLPAVGAQTSADDGVEIAGRSGQPFNICLNCGGRLLVFLDELSKYHAAQNRAGCRRPKFLRDRCFKHGKGFGNFAKLDGRLCGTVKVAGGVGPDRKRAANVAG